MNTEAIIKFFRSDYGKSPDACALMREHLDALAMIEDDSLQKKLLGELIEKYVALEKRVDALLKNALPAEVADTIKYNGKYVPHPCMCTILFSDIAGFTGLAEKVRGKELIELLDRLFKGFDDIVGAFRGTKIKTIGDAYMAVFGAPAEFEDHAMMAVRAGMAFLKFVDASNRENRLNLQVRIGIHTGQVMAGVVGKERMQFDVFGDNVNIASRFESSGEEGKLNISHETFLLARDFFEFEERGEITLKNKANMKAYFVVRERG